MTNDVATPNAGIVARKSGRLRFSLRALLFVTAFVVVVASHTYTSWQLREVRQENILLRQEIDRFPVEDESKLHVAAITSPDPLTWRWRVYVPRGRKFVLRTEHKNLPVDGLPTPLGWVGDELAAGELIVTVTAHKERNGRWSLLTMAPQQRSRFFIPAANATWLDTADVGVRQEGRDGIKMVPMGEIAVLLRARKSKHLAGGAVTVDTQPTDGVMIWIEEQATKKPTE
jgi:hypothetical protein